MNNLKISRIFKDAGKYSRTTKCFSRIKDITSFDSKFKDCPWRCVWQPSAVSVNDYALLVLTAIHINPLTGTLTDAEKCQVTENRNMLLL